MSKKWVIIIVVLISLIIIPIGASRNGNRIIEVKANKNKGFYTNYYLYIPKRIDNDKNSVLLVEPNNTGTTSDNHKQHESAVINKMEYGISVKIAEELGIPLLVPVFDRLDSHWQMYTHSLDRESLKNNKGYLKRIDLQLINMIKDSKVILKEYGINIADDVLLNGFSASGSFVNRFTAIHPKKVRAVVAGGINCMPILPIETLDNKTLIYPIGIGDIKELINIEFDLQEYTKVPQFIYMGSLDDNDTLPYDDAFGEEERILIKLVLGTKMLDRWNRSKMIYEEQKINAKMVMYEGIGHTMNDDVKKDIKNFLRDNI
ncbi:MAG: hypothetical protein OCD02_21340 [Spirochaetaceae bacterium]